MIGLGRMGANMARRLMRGGHECVGYDRSQANVADLAGNGATAATSLEDLVAKLDTPRAVWIMVPAGAPTEETVQELGQTPGPAAIRSSTAAIPSTKTTCGAARTWRPPASITSTSGTSGGVWGLERGYCMMMGGPKEAVARLDPIFKTLAPGIGDIPRTPGCSGQSTAEQGYLYCGPSGAGHFVKMVHNGIEYGVMQAYAEGFDILRGANSDHLPHGLSYDLNIADISELWRRGSVISSWLLDLTAQALATDGELASYTGFVEDSGEGRWTIAAALEEGVSAEVLSTASFTRSPQNPKTPKPQNPIIKENNINVP